MTSKRYVPLAVAAVLLLIGVSAEVARHAGWRVNLTASEPTGLYRLQPVTETSLFRGALVEFCPPTWVTPLAYPFYMSGDCPQGGKPMLKMIAGVPGDRISASEDGVTINGTRLPGSTPRLRSIQYPEVLLPRFRGNLVLGDGQYWVYGSGERPAFAASSFDSRYFGPIRGERIRGLVVPATALPLDAIPSAPSDIVHSDDRDGADIAPPLNLTLSRHDA
jgi:conjugative transfer signal peptidase TraF